MGEFAARIDNVHNSIANRITIILEGVSFLARHGCFCRIKKDDIEDKSKSDLLAKGLVCFQVLWMAGQTIDRQLAGYPVTLLEVHTLVHVECAITMYALWMQKPLNVRDPTMVEFRDSPEILAFMVEYSRKDVCYERQSCWGNFSNTRAAESDNGEEPVIIWYKDLATAPVIPQELSVPSTREQLIQIPSSRLMTLSDITTSFLQGGSKFSGAFVPSRGTDGSVKYRYYTWLTEDEFVPKSNEDIVRIVASGESSPLGYGARLPRKNSNYVSEETSSRYLLVDLVSLSEKDVLRLDSTARFLAQVTVTTPSDTSPNGEESQSYFRNVSLAYAAATFHTETEMLLAKWAPNMTADTLFSYRGEAAYMYSALALLPAAYGAIHIGALQLMWKISCYTLTMSAVACGLIGLFAYLNHRIERKWSVDMWKFVENFCCDSGIAQCLSCIFYIRILFTIFLAYIESRLYIVVESFVSLRHVPVGVYQTPEINFMNYIPHL